MTTKEFASLVQDMRRNQKKFFETRDPYYLKLSKDLEKKVDKETEEIINSIHIKNNSDGKEINIDG